MKKGILFLIAAAALLVIMPLGAGVISAQGPTATPTSAFGNFGTLLGGTATPTSASTASDPIKQALAQNNYTVISSGNWYDAQGKVLTDSVYVMMLSASTDPKGDTSVRQIASGFSALRSQYATATSYHVLLLNTPFIYDASTTSSALQLLTTQLVTPDAFIKDVLAQMRTINLVQGGALPNATATATRTSTRPSSVLPTPTRKPTTATSSCNPPAGQARLWVKNGYSGTMRFTIGAPDVGFQKDYDIPADGQYHYIDLPPSGKYTYSASIPGVGKASAKLPSYSAGQCYYLTFAP